MSYKNFFFIFLRETELIWLEKNRNLLKKIGSNLKKTKKRVRPMATASRGARAKRISAELDSRSTAGEMATRFAVPCGAG